MIYRIFTVLFFVLLTTNIPAAETAVEVTPFQGNWEVVELVEDGKVIPREAIKQWLPSGGRAEVVENAIIFRSPQDGKKFAKVFSVDPTRYPKGIDVTTREGHVSRGIYRFDNNRLVICLSSPYSPLRPEEFSAGKGSQRMLMVLQRVQATPAVAAASATPAVTSQGAPGATAIVLDDAEVKKMLVGTWAFTDGVGTIQAVLSADGTFYSVRDVAEIHLFQTVFVRTPVSSGTWNVNNGQLIYYVGTSTNLDRAGRTLGLTIRSVSSKDLIFVDGLGRVGTAVRTQ